MRNMEYDLCKATGADKVLIYSVPEDLWARRITAIKSINGKDYEYPCSVRIETVRDVPSAIEEIKNAIKRTLEEQSAE